MTKYQKALRAARIKRLKASRPKAMRRIKALALARKLARSGCISRCWNIHADENGKTVWVSAPVKELNKLRKEMGIRKSIQNRYRSDYTESMWATLILAVR